MMKKAYGGLLVLLLFGGGPHLKGGDKEEKGPPPELQALDYFVGEWSEQAVMKKAEWTPKETTSTATGKRQWILGKRVIENRGVWQPGNIEFLHLQTYDPDRKEYRTWYFDSSGALPKGEESGQWNAKTKTFTFKGVPGPGLTSHFTGRIVDDDHWEWTYLIKDGSNKKFLDISAKATRMKAK